MNLDLEPIRRRFDHYKNPDPGTAVWYVQALIAEVERLRAELVDARFGLEENPS